MAVPAITRSPNFEGAGAGLGAGLAAGRSSVGFTGSGGPAVIDGRAGEGEAGAAARLDGRNPGGASARRTAGDDAADRPPDREVPHSVQSGVPEGR